jgi:3-methyladenine DNA glycosylase AlkC
MIRWVRLFALGCLAIALSACATSTLTRLAYNNAASTYANLAPMLTWMVDDYADLDSTREDWVRTRFDRTLHWHRSAELPRLRAMLELMLAKSDAPYRVEDIAAQQRDLREAYHRLLEHVIPDSAELLATLDSAQLEHMERKVADDNRKYLKESVKGTPEERTERRARKLIAHLEAWVGDLSSEQRALVYERYKGMRDLSEEMVGERRYRQAEVIALVRAKPPRAQLEAGLKRLFVDTDSWRRADYRAKIAERDVVLHSLVADLSATLSEEQRAALRKRIRGYLRDIAKLSEST